MNWFAWLGVAVCLIALWAVARRDLARRSGPSRRVLARVVGHKFKMTGGEAYYAAIYRFSARGVEHEIIDSHWHAAPTPEDGTFVEFVYPDGRPDLAQPARPWASSATYAAILVVLAAMLSIAFGWLG